MRLVGRALMKQRRLAEAEEQIRFALSLELGSLLLHEDFGSILAMRERWPCPPAKFERDYLNRVRQWFDEYLN